MFAFHIVQTAYAYSVIESYITIYISYIRVCTAVAGMCVQRTLGKT